MRPGSSPRVRGTGRRGVSLRSLMAVHPRVCGEQAYRVVNDMASIGSSPRVRGTDEPLVNAYAEIRFIPACAGNSNQRDVTRSIQAVHPRVCGEQWIWQGLSENTLGSSPRVRGTGRKQQRQDSERRFIPACAGNRPVASRYGPTRSVHPRVCEEQGAGLGMSPVHPRVCGEQGAGLGNQAIAVGSSPRVRGTVFRSPKAAMQSRFIPACAGNSASSSSIILSVTVHPACAGNSQLCQGPSLQPSVHPACAGNRCQSC